MILISSDKAVRPANIMGVTKRISELICQAKSKIYDSTKFSIVRFGNVIGSSGSVIPKFNKQILKGGPVSVTDRKITRYFMTIKEAAGLVIQASALGKNGQIFVLDMGKPINIFSLAKKMIKLHGFKPTTNQFSNKDNHKILIKFTGLRKGEKMYEELFINKKIYKTKHPRIFKTNENDFSHAMLEKFLVKLNKLIVDKNLKNIKKHLNSLSKEFKIN